MEFEFNGKTYWVEWESMSEYNVSDEDGNDIDDDDVLAEAEEIVREEYIGQAEWAMDAAKDAAMGL